MPTELELESFWDLLRRSAVIAEEEFEPLRSEYVKELANLDTAEKVADDLVVRCQLTRWQADMILQGRHKGFFLGPYRLLELLGKGGMGSVYLAEHQLIRRRTAVKVLPSKAISRRPSLKERFRREAQAVASLDHPNIVRAYDFSKELLDKTDVYYLAMEFVQGKNLQELVQNEGPLNYVQAADCIRQAALGLSHAHAAGLVHRDIKPANLLIDTKGVVKLLDLGLVKSYKDSDEASLTGEHENTVLGTADYLAPEQAASSRDVDSRADIYSLGYTFYFALCGHPPFPQGTIHQRMVAHQSRHADPITNERPDTPSELIVIIDKMIAKQPVDRYATAGEVAEILENWLFENADEDWILEHPGLLAEGSDPLTLSGRGSRPEMSKPDDEVELDLAPIDDDKIAVADNEVGSESVENESSQQTQAIEHDETVPSSVLSDTALPPLEGVRLDQLLKTNPVTAGRALRPIEPLSSIWSIDGIAARLGVPPVAVIVTMLIVATLFCIVAFLVLSNATGVAETAVPRGLILSTFPALGVVQGRYVNTKNYFQITIGDDYSAG